MVFPIVNLLCVLVLFSPEIASTFASVSLKIITVTKNIPNCKIKALILRNFVSPVIMQKKKQTNCYHHLSLFNKISPKLCFSQNEIYVIFCRIMILLKYAHSNCWSIFIKRQTGDGCILIGVFVSISILSVWSISVLRNF